MKKISFLLYFALLIAASAIDMASPSPIVYLTWQKSPESTMTIHWISREESEDIIQYRRGEEKEWHQAAGSHKPLPEGYHHLFIHTCELTKLHPNSHYLFTVDGQKQEYHFRTLPATLTEPLRFVEGGDMYHGNEEILNETSRQAARQDPHFALVGGDIAYSTEKIGDNPEEMGRWLIFLSAWQKTMVRSDGCLIPLVVTIGNEEVKGRYDQPTSQARGFYTLFAFPGPQGYNVLDIGNYMSVVVLDSGHTHSVDGEQSFWLKNTLRERIDIPHKFAIYHVGAYPAFRTPDRPLSAAIRKYWVPLFEKYHIKAAFEHHDHTYKRTHFLRGGESAPDGVLYLGDGGWGATPTRRPVKPEERSYLAHTAQERHFLLVTLYPDGSRHFDAINEKGEVFDSIDQQ